MNIAILCHYFAPEPGAPSARLLELARAWVAAGHTVKVVTCFPNHPTGCIPAAYRGKLRGYDEVDGIQVFRNWVYATPNEGILKKTLGHISFMLSSVLLSLFRVGQLDVIVVSSPTFFSMFSGYVFSRIRRVPLVVEVRDLWPAAIVELGVLRNRMLIRVLESMELFMYRAAQHVVVVTESFRSNLVARGIPADKVSVVTNGVDLQAYLPGPKDETVELELDCRGRRLALYIGAHGLSQGLDTLVHASQHLREHDNIVFAFVGEGAAKAKLQSMVNELGLHNVRFLPAQPKDRMPDFYRTADVCLVPLKDVPIFETFIPSKIFEIMACGRPIVASLRGESAAILERSGAAVVVPPEDARAVASEVLTLMDDEDRRTKMGYSGALFVSHHYCRRQLAEKYEGILRALV